MPNLTHIVGKDQRMFFYYEVYDPATADGVTPDVRTSLAFYRGKVKVFETPVVERANIDDPSRKAAMFQLEVPAGSLPPGFYTCQINIIDSVAGEVRVPAAGVPDAVAALRVRAPTKSLTGDQETGGQEGSGYFEPAEFLLPPSPGLL